MAYRPFTADELDYLGTCMKQASDALFRTASEMRDAKFERVFLQVSGIANDAAAVFNLAGHMQFQLMDQMRAERENKIPEFRKRQNKNASDKSKRATAKPTAKTPRKKRP